MRHDDLWIIIGKQIIVKIATTLFVFALAMGAINSSFSAAPKEDLTNRARDAAIDRPMVVAKPEQVSAEQIATGLTHPWSLAFLPTGGMLITEKLAGIRHLAADGSLGPLLSGGPLDVYMHTESGFLDVVLDPDYSENGEIFIAYSSGTEAENRVAIWRARLDGNRLVNGRTIFRSHDAKAGAPHPGGRMLFLLDDTLLLTTGDGYDYKDRAQDMGSHLGKIVRLTREGEAPEDNPFIGREDVLPEIYTSGHRNAQGLTLDAETGMVWAHEHGPRGGDEINLIEAGKNYGWPIVTHGIDYDGEIISALSHVAGVARAKFFWAPSIAPSGLAVYRGSAHPEWDGQFFVGGLASHALSQLRRGEQTGLFIEEDRHLSELDQRLRDVRVGPDGHVYVLTDGENAELWRLVTLTE